MAIYGYMDDKALPKDAPPLIDSLSKIAQAFQTTRLQNTRAGVA
jgi:hypothetical protein